MNYPNKFMEAVALFAAVLTFLLMLALVISSDAFSTATQAQAHGELALMQPAAGITDNAHDEMTPDANRVMTQ